MLTQQATGPQVPHPENFPPDLRTVRIGVGIDTSRYGHYVAFLNEDLQPAASELAFAESPQGYRQFRQRLDQLISKHGCVHFAMRLDVAGQYADNLVHFLHQLTSGDHPWSLTISCGDPQRNKNYRRSLWSAKVRPRRSAGDGTFRSHRATGPDGSIESGDAATSTGRGSSSSHGPTANPVHQSTASVAHVELPGVGFADQRHLRQLGSHDVAKLPHGPGVSQGECGRLVRDCVSPRRANSGDFATGQGVNRIHEW